MAEYFTRGASIILALENMDGALVVDKAAAIRARETANEFSDPVGPELGRFEFEPLNPLGPNLGPGWLLILADTQLPEGHYTVDDWVQVDGGTSYTERVAVDVGPPVTERQP